MQKPYETPWQGNIANLEKLTAAIAQTDFKEPHPRKSYIPLVEAIHSLLSAGPAILPYFLAAVSRAKETTAGLADIPTAILESVAVSLAKSDPGPLLDDYLRAGYAVVDPHILAEIGEAAVPKLIQGLSAFNPQVIENCADCLRHIGPAAKAAVPALLMAAFSAHQSGEEFAGEDGPAYWCIRAALSIDPDQAMRIVEKGCQA